MMAEKRDSILDWQLFGLSVVHISARDLWPAQDIF